EDFVREAPRREAERHDGRQHRTAARHADQSRSVSRLMTAPHVHVIQTRSPSTPPSRSPQCWCSWKKALSESKTVTPRWRKRALEFAPHLETTTLRSSLRD